MLKNLSGREEPLSRLLNSVPLPVISFLQLHLLPNMTKRILLVPCSRDCYEDIFGGTLEATGQTLCLPWKATSSTLDLLLQVLEIFFQLQLKTSVIIQSGLKGLRIRERISFKI